MPEGHVLEFSGVTKRFGPITAVSGFTARVEPGRVTGFLGPNGAGKTTTLRILLGLVAATDGIATIGGKTYARLDRPLQTVGAVLEASSFHPGRTAANHLAVYADAAGIPRTRVDEVLGLVGLADAAGRKVGGFSLGMRQRLGLAYALIGDPGVLVLDEPANGLDPEGIKWMRGFLRRLAGEGRTVLTSSHLLTEVQQTVDSLLIISHGRLVFQGALEDLADPSEYATVVDGPDRAALVAALDAAGVSFEVLRSGLTVRGLEPVAVGEIAASAGIVLSSLQRRGPALEEVFLDLVNGTRVHSSTGAERVPGAMPGVVPDVAAAATIAGATTVIAHYGPAPEEPAADVAPDEQDISPDEPDVALDEPAVSPAAFAVASTGVIDVLPFAATEEDAVDAAPEPEADATTDDQPADEPTPFEALVDEESDGDSLDEVDEELGDATDDTSNDRPWEEYVKTDSDLEADAFFASFDEQKAAAAAAEAARSGENSAPEPDPEPEPEPEPIVDEPPTETSEFGALADLSPDWVESDPQGESDPEGDDDQEGEQR
jgi:ABC-2 type transport system ATP-binding protein